MAHAAALQIVVIASTMIGYFCENISDVLAYKVLKGYSTGPHRVQHGAQHAYTQHWRVASC